MIITSITAQKKGERVNIFIDDKFSCGISAESLVKFRLKKGQEISQQRLDEVCLESDKEVAFGKVLGLLNRRMKTRKEIEKYLYDKGYAPVVIEDCISKLLQYKYIDDEHYADAFVEANYYKSGKKMIRYKLAQKGIKDKDITLKLEQMPNQYDVVKALACKYMKNKEHTLAVGQKLYRYLLSKGFDGSDVGRVVKEVIKETEDESWD